MKLSTKIFLGFASVIAISMTIGLLVLVLLWAVRRWCCWTLCVN